MKPAFKSRLETLWRKDLRPFLILALVLFSLRSSLADWNDVPTGSMIPTILVGDRVWVNKLAYDLKVPFTTFRLAEWGAPQRGEIVVFYSPADGTRLVKRVVGLPGDTLELRHNHVILNGQPVNYQAPASDDVEGLKPTDLGSRVYARERLPGQIHPVAATPGVQALRDFGPFTVPAGHFFMMGDNRDESFDSRYFGPVPRHSIVGRASGVVFSLDRQNYWQPRLGRWVQPLDRD